MKVDLKELNKNQLNDLKNGAKKLGPLQKAAMKEMKNHVMSQIRTESKKDPSSIKVLQTVNNYGSKISNNIKTFGSRIKSIANRTKDIFSESIEFLEAEDISEDKKQIKGLFQRLYDIFVLKSLKKLYKRAKEEISEMSKTDIIKMLGIALLALLTIGTINFVLFGIIGTLLVVMGVPGMAAVWVPAILVAPVTEEIAKYLMQSISKSVLPATGVFLGEFAQYVATLTATLGGGIAVIPKMILIVLMRTFALSMHAETINDTADNGKANLKENIKLHAFWNSVVAIPIQMIFSLLNMTGSVLL